MVGSCPICKNAYNNLHLGKNQITIDALILSLSIYKCGSCGIHYGVEIAEREE